MLVGDIHVLTLPLEGRRWLGERFYCNTAMLRIYGGQFVLAARMQLAGWPSCTYGP